MAFDLSSWWRRERTQAEVRMRGRSVNAERVTNPYHSVSIVAGASCSQTALRYGGRRYLIQEAPSIPLWSCDSRNCRCRYLHHQDRRDGSDRRRRDASDAPTRIPKGGDRRGSYGRRATDR
jgi:hypothetical protein